MHNVIIVNKATGPVACLLGPGSRSMLHPCLGCQAYDKHNVPLCVETDVDCTQNGGEVLAAIKVYVGTRFEAETHTGRVIKDALVHSIVEWRDYPLQVYWNDATGKHIEPFALHEFKKIKFL